jgi:uncharacterized protein
MSTSQRQRQTVEEIGHRPYPPPSEPWVMAQSWLHLLFAHWPTAPSAMEPLLPPGLELDTWEGSAWVAITPFAVEGLRPRLLPPVPPLSHFLETNVRTYVRRDGRPGILFFSLDATSRTAARAARTLYQLPYFAAEGSMDVADNAVAYRIKRRGQPQVLHADYAADGPAAPAQRGKLEHFLAERYCFYTRSPIGGLLRCEIHHPPWMLAPASGEVSWRHLLPPGLPRPDTAPLLHYAARQDVVAWRPMRVRA